MSLMLQHQKAVREQKQAGQDVAPSASASSAIGPAPAGLIGTQQLAALLDKALAVDLAKLKEIRSRDGKADLKEGLLEKYAGYVTRLQDSGQLHDLLGWFLVWLFDTKKLGRAVAHGLWCVAHGVTLPERFARDLPTFVADAILEWAECEVEAGRTPEPYFTQIFAPADGLCGTPWDLPDEVTAKFYRLRGLWLLEDGKPELAAEALEVALDMGAKVKTALGQARKQVS